MVELQHVVELQQVIRKQVKDKSTNMRYYTVSDVIMTANRSVNNLSYNAGTYQCYINPLYYDVT